MARTNLTAGLYLEILRAIEDGPKTTPELAAAIGITGSRIYHRCRRLQDEKAWLRSVLLSHPQPFCIDCLEILTSATYPDHEDHEIRQSSTPVRRWELTEKGRDALGSVPSAAPSSRS